MWNPILVRLETVLDRCMVSVEDTISLQSILDAPMVLLGDDAQVEARFGRFGDRANPDAR